MESHGFSVVLSPVIAPSSTRHAPGLPSQPLRSFPLNMDTKPSSPWACVQTLGTEIPSLGVCLGHQAIVAAFGGIIDLAPEPRHGKTSEIRHDGKGVFANLEMPFIATRYHSLAAVELPAELEACAWSEDGVIQGIRHLELPMSGVQFHPESVLTSEGKKLLTNFLEATG